MSACLRVANFCKNKPDLEAAPLVHSFLRPGNALLSLLIRPKLLDFEAVDKLLDFEAVDLKQCIFEIRAGATAKRGFDRSIVRFWWHTRSSRANRKGRVRPGPVPIL
jgi:hypothetical protein